MSLRLVFIMDPIDRINIDGDSTFVLMLEAQRRGHQVLYTTQNHLELDGQKPQTSAWPITTRRARGDHYTLGSVKPVVLSEVDAVFMRKDPPFNIEYLTATYILDRIDRRRVVLINDPRGLRSSNEKLFALEFPSVTPRTIVTATPSRVRDFIQEVGDVVVKPLMNAGGSGVIRLSRNDANTGAILDLLTSEGRIAIAAQQYLPEVVEGDRRIILFAGRPVGVINRRPKATDLRSNMHVGGTAEPAQLTQRDLQICAILEPELVARGLVFVGIDVIGGYLTEINVTSPTGIQEIDRFDGVCLEGQLLDWIEARCAERGDLSLPR